MKVVSNTTCCSEKRGTRLKKFRCFHYHWNFHFPNSIYKGEVRTAINVQTLGKREPLREKVSCCIRKISTTLSAENEFQSSESPSANEKNDSMRKNFQKARKHRNFRIVRSTSSNVLPEIRSTRFLKPL